MLSAHNLLSSLVCLEKRSHTETNHNMKPFRYGIFAKLVVGTFLSFFLLFRIEGTAGAACFATESSPQLRCSVPESRLMDTNQLYKVSMDIPGVEPQDLDVSVDNDSRTVKLVGKRRDDDGDVIGCYQKSWQLDDSADLESLVMQHDNGVLTVWVPKEADGKQKFVAGKERKKDTKKKRASSFVRGSTKLSNPPNVSKPTPFIVKKIKRNEDIILTEEDPMEVDPIAYDEKELLESVSVLTDEEGERWVHRM